MCEQLNVWKLQSIAGYHCFGAYIKRQVKKLKRECSYYYIILLVIICIFITKNNKKLMPRNVAFLCTAIQIFGNAKLTFVFLELLK